MSKLFPLTNETFIKCGEGCNNPGLSHPAHDPYDNKCSDCALFCCPCAFATDVFTMPFRPFVCLWRRIRNLSNSVQDTDQDTDQDSNKVSG